MRIQDDPPQRTPTFDAAQSQARIVRSAFGLCEIPIRHVLEPGGVAVQESELRPLVVQIGMDNNYGFTTGE